MSVQKLIASLCYIVCVLPTLNKTYLFIYLFIYVYQEDSSASPVFSEVRVTRSLVLCVCFVDRCLSSCPFLLAIVLSVLRITDSDYRFGIFKLLLSGGHITRSLVFCVMLYISLFVFFFWPLCCLFIVDLLLLITSLVS